MKQFFDSNDTLTALEAQHNAQKIAFAPVVFQVARCMRDFGVLQALFDNKNGLTLQNLCEKTSLTSYGLLVLLESSLSADIIKQKNDKYFLTKTGYFLLKDPMTIANMDYNHYVNYKALYHLDASIESHFPKGLKEFGEWNTIYPALSSLPLRVKDSWFAFDHLYSDSAFPEAVKVISKFSIKNILDIGGNTGKFSVLLAQENLNVHIAILDLPSQLALAKKSVTALGLKNRISFIEGDVLSVNFAFPEGYDALWMSQFLDCFSEDEIICILTKAKQAMSDESMLFIMEPFWDRQRFETSAFCIINTSPYFTVMANGNSKMYHSKDFFRLIEKAGLKIAKITDNVGICQTILTLKK